MTKRATSVVPSSVKYHTENLGPFTIRELRLGGYKVHTYYTIDYGTITDPDASPRTREYWKPVKLEIHFRVTLNGKIVNSFLSLAAAKRWCKEQINANEL